MSEAKERDQSAPQPKTSLNPTAQAVTFFPGLYMFTVRAASPRPVSDAGDLLMPALLVAAGPGTPPGSVEFVGNPAASSVWLCQVGDSTVVKIGAGSATLLLNSIRVAGDTQAFDVHVDRLDAQQVAGSSAMAAPAAVPARRSLKLRIGLHLLRHGDVEFVDAEWAGRSGSGIWIEAFSIVPLEVLESADIEYKGLAANGFETPWLSEGGVCGTRGVTIPLIGFAIRLKPTAALDYDCEYSAAFRSGVVVGPLRNGVPCRSKLANDPLDAMQVRLLRREKPAAPLLSPEAMAAVSAVAKRKVTKAPSFGRFREDEPEAPASATPPLKGSARPITKGPSAAGKRASTSRPTDRKAGSKRK